MKCMENVVGLYGPTSLECVSYYFFSRIGLFRPALPVIGLNKYYVNHKPGNTDNEWVYTFVYFFTIDTFDFYSCQKSFFAANLHGKSVFAADVNTKTKAKISIHFNLFSSTQGNRLFSIRHHTNDLFSVLVSPIVVDKDKPEIGWMCDLRFLIYSSNFYTYKFSFGSLTTMPPIQVLINYLVRSQIAFY